MNNPLVSVIITTKNEESYLESLLKSINDQTYKKIEIIIVDNNSQDKTKEIARRYTALVFNKGPERSAQRNFGASQAKGEYLLFLDADMELEKSVIEECILEIVKQKVGALIIPEKTIGIGFWAKVKAYERSFYVGDQTMEAARFYKRQVFDVAGKFDEEITGPEDWDLSQNTEKKYGVGRIRSYITHNEGRLSLWGLMKKKYYYAKKTRAYLKKNSINAISPKTIFFLRGAFYKNPEKIFSHPILFCGMMLMLTFELIAGFLGFFESKI